ACSHLDDRQRAAASDQVQQLAIRRLGHRKPSPGPSAEPPSQPAGRRPTPPTSLLWYGLPGPPSIGSEGFFRFSSTKNCEKPGSRAHRSAPPRSERPAPFEDVMARPSLTWEKRGASTAVRWPQMPAPARVP